MHEQIKWHDACPNAVQLSSNSQNWLEHRVFNTKTQNFEKPLDQFERIRLIDHHTR